MKTATIYIYLLGGIKHSYQFSAPTDVLLAAKAREHTVAIAEGGFRANSGNGDFEWFSPRWVDKIKVTGCNVPTEYATEPTGT
jgi:hypothetical protein